MASLLILIDSGVNYRVDSYFFYIISSIQSGNTPFTHSFGHLPGRAADITGSEDARDIGALGLIRFKMGCFAQIMMHFPRNFDQCPQLFAYTFAYSSFRRNTAFIAGIRPRSILSCNAYYLCAFLKWVVLKS
jgi:hypothetical protein